MLRVFLDAPPLATRADAWVRFAADGRAAAHGRGAPDAWPADPVIEAVLTAAQVRMVALDLPPMPASRRRAAAQFALEDQVASTAAESAIAVGQAREGGPVLAAVVADALIRAIAAYPRRFARIIPEPALAPYGDGWTWCRSAGGDGFIRRRDGSSFAIGGADASPAEIPAELAAALAQAARAGAAPAVVHAALSADATQLAKWSQETGVRFAAVPEWHWKHAAPAAFANAPDFLARDTEPAKAPERSRNARRFRPALVLATLALLIHFGALLAQWAWLRIEDWQLARALVAQAAAAQLPDAATPAAAAAAIARRNAELRHRASQDAPADALPLLARAAPPIAGLPAGALKSATFAGSAWTLELAKLDPVAVSTLTRALAANGIDALAAPTVAGLRMRLTLDATAR